MVERVVEQNTETKTNQNKNKKMEILDQSWRQNKNKQVPAQLSQARTSGAARFLFSHLRDTHRSARAGSRRSEPRPV